MRRVYCATCNTQLDEPPDLPEGARKPCPVCGSTARLFVLEASDHVPPTGDFAVATVRSRELYSIPDAARFARTRPRNLRRWAEGYSVRGKSYEPLLALPAERRFSETLLSFENLVEAALIAGWRRHGVPLQRIRRAHALAIEEFGPHPFVAHEVYVGGKDLFVEADQQVEGGTHFIALTRAGQRGWSRAISRYLETVDWQTGRGVPYQWRPLEGGNVVTLHPEIEFGLPSVRRVRTETLLRRFLGRESITEIAADFRLDHQEVEQAIRYEWALTPTAA